VRPFLLAISVIRSGIGGQGKNADKHFAAVNPESQASLEPGQAFVRRTAHCRLPTPSRQAQEDKGVKCVAAVPVTQQKRLENRGSTGTGRSLQGSGPCPTRRNIGFRARLQRIALSMSFVSKGFAEEIVPVPGRAL